MQKKSANDTLKPIQFPYQLLLIFDTKCCSHYSQGNAHFNLKKLYRTPGITPEEIPSYGGMMNLESQIEIKARNKYFLPKKLSSSKSYKAMLCDYYSAIHYLEREHAKTYVTFR